MKFLKLAMFLAAISSVAADGFMYLESAKASFSFVPIPFGSDFQQLYCESQGASLWVPESAREVTSVLGLFKHEEFSHVWLGIFAFPDMNMNGLLDVDGREDFYTSWGDKNNSIIDEAVKMTKAGIFATDYSFRNYPAICVRRETSFYMNTRKTADGYTHIPKFNASYKYYKHFSSVLSLDNIMCRRDGAGTRLWVPESDEEVAHIFSTIVPRQYGEINVGIYNTFQSGFIAVDGRKNYYSNWIYGHPQDINVNTIVMRNGSYLSDGIGNEGFVCKRADYPTDVVVDTTGYQYNTQIDKLFKVHWDKKNFNEAGKACRSEQGTLLMMDNIESLEQVFRTVKRKMKSFWLGYRKLGREQYIFTNGQVAKIQEMDWSQHGCGFLSDGYTFSATACDSEYPFICQININELGFINGYMFVPYAMTWYEAARFCSSKGTSIVTFEDDREPETLIELFPKINVAFVGYFKTANAKQIMPLKEFDTDILLKMEWEVPPVTEGYCVGMNKNRQLLALDCNQPQPFICSR